MAGKAHVMLTPFDASSGAALTSATVNVYQPGTVTPVAGTIYDKNSNPLSNPLTSDATTGLVDFYMNVAQEVDLQVAKSGFTTRTYSNVPVLDDAGNDLSALMTALGDIVYASAANTPARLAVGSANQVMAITAGLPAWNSSLTISTLTTNGSSPTLNLPVQSGGVAKAIAWADNGAGFTSILGNTVGGSPTTCVLRFDIANGSPGGSATALTLRGDGAAVIPSIIGPTTLSGQVNHTGASLGFYNHSAATQASVTGSRGGNAALASLLTGLAATGIIVDSSTA